MTRILALALLAILASPALLAQDNGVVLRLDISRDLDASASGTTDSMDATGADKLILTYTLHNPTKSDMALGPASLWHAFNCDVVMTTAPASTVAAGSSTVMILELTPAIPGPMSCNVDVSVDGAPYSFVVDATVVALLGHNSGHRGRHCSTGEGGNWWLAVGLAALLAPVLLRRRAA